MYVQKTALCRKSIKQNNEYKKEKIQVTGCMHGSATILSEGKVLLWGGVWFRSFFIESKFFQLILEEGGPYYRLQIFERGKFFMRSVFMGKKCSTVADV